MKARTSALGLAVSTALIASAQGPLTAAQDLASPATSANSAPDGSGSVAWKTVLGAELAYDIVLEGRLYRARRLGLPDAMLFTNEAGHPETRPGTLAQLAAAAWTVDNVVRDPYVRNGQKRVAMHLDTASALRAYQVIQDALVRLNVEAIKFGLTGGSSAMAAATGLSWGIVKNHLTEPKSWLASQAVQSLEDAGAAYRELERSCPPAVGASYDAEALRRTREAYWVALGLELSGGALSAALLPKSQGVLWEQGLATAASQALGAIGTIPGIDEQAVTVGQLLLLTRRLAENVAGVTGMRLYAENLELGMRLRASTESRLLQSAVSGAAAAGPDANAYVLPYIERRAHPFECAQYGNWMATQALEVYEEPRRTSRRLGAIPAGAALVAETGETQTIDPGQVVVTRAAEIVLYAVARPGYGDLESQSHLFGAERVALQPGETLQLLACYGEGACRLVYGGRWGDLSIDTPLLSGVSGFVADARAPHRVSEWWVLVHTASGLRGWVLDPTAEGACSCC